MLLTSNSSKNQQISAKCAFLLTPVQCVGQLPTSILSTQKQLPHKCAGHTHSWKWRSQSFHLQVSLGIWSISQNKLNWSQKTQFSLIRNGDRHPNIKNWRFSSSTKMSLSSIFEQKWVGIWGGGVQLLWLWFLKHPVWALFPLFVFEVSNNSFCLGSLSTS